MKLICYSDGWTMIPYDVTLIGCDIRTYYKCPHCDKVVMLEDSYPCDQPISIHIDEDLKVKRFQA